MGGIAEVVLDKFLLASAAAVRQGYITYLDDQKKEKERGVVNMKRTLMEEEFDGGLKAQKRALLS